MSKRDHPIINVSWYAAMAYANGQINGYPKQNGRKLRAAALTAKDIRGVILHLLTTPVGKYPPNGYDLFDMCGNVWEWCLDAYHEGFAMSSSPQNPISGANTIGWIVNHFIDVESNRVLRGGSWRIPASSNAKGS